MPTGVGQLSPVFGRSPVCSRRTELFDRPVQSDALVFITVIRRRRPDGKQTWCNVVTTLLCSGKRFGVLCLRLGVPSYHKRPSYPRAFDYYHLTKNREVDIKYVYPLFFPYMWGGPKTNHSNKTSHSNSLLQYLVNIIPITIFFRCLWKRTIMIFFLS